MRASRTRIPSRDVVNRRMRATAAAPVSCRLPAVQVHRINPLDDPRWDDLVASHPRASIFHSAAWLRARRATYGYRPLALTTSSAGEPLGDSFVFCEIHSWLTGNRI